MPVQITLNKARVPVKVFTRDIEHDAIQQLLNVAQLPIVHGHVAAMPAKRRFNRFDLAKQTEGVECRKDGGVIDEIPAAYKDIDAVMANQSDLVDVVHTLKQVMCIKG